MTIFGKSKKKPTTTQLQSQSAATVHKQSNHQGPYNAFQSNWPNDDRRVNPSHGYGPPAVQGWVIGSSPQYQALAAPHDHVAPPQQTPRTQKGQKTQKGCEAIRKLNLSSVSNLLAGDVPPCITGARIFNDAVPDIQQQGAEYLCRGAALYDLVTSKFNTIVTLIDGERFSGDEGELAIFQPLQPTWRQDPAPAGYASQDLVQGKSKGFVNNPISNALTSTNYFAKVNLYANSRLPMNLPPMKLYISTFPLLCLAAQYSERVYTKPSGKERDAHVDADWRLGTKAMVVKSVPMDDMNVIVFAIRGSQTFMDWAVNLKSDPAVPEGFLDDPGNYCHAGFLNVARRMVKPVAARLRHLLEEDPGRSRYSLLITGHSAGGAIAALLYCHMLATSREAESELNVLTGCFKRIHCVSFGAPPVSLLPLTKPSNPALQKSLFLSFINEGDPVARADKAYVRSLLDLYSTPAPNQPCLESVTPQKLQPHGAGIGGKSSSSLTVNKIRPPPKRSKSSPPTGSAPIWKVPEATLSNAGRLVLLRSVERHEDHQNKKKFQNRMDEGILAQMVTDELLRGVVWGDPVCHMMRLYGRRIEILATNAVVGKG